MAIENSRLSAVAIGAAYPGEAYKLKIENNIYQDTSGRYFVSADMAAEMYLTEASVEIAKADANIWGEMRDELADSLSRINIDDFEWLTVEDDEPVVMVQMGGEEGL